jgi:hypothetical protein
VENVRFLGARDTRVDRAQRQTVPRKPLQNRRKARKKGDCPLFFFFKTGENQEKRIFSCLGDPLEPV